MGVFPPLSLSDKCTRKAHSIFLHFFLQILTLEMDVEAAWLGVYPPVMYQDTLSMRELLYFKSTCRVIIIIFWGIVRFTLPYFEKSSDLP